MPPLGRAQIQRDRRASSRRATFTRSAALRRVAVSRDAGRTVLLQVGKEAMRVLACLQANRGAMPGLASGALFFGKAPMAWITAGGQRYPEVIGEIEKQPDRGAFWKSISSGTSAIATIPRIAGF
jgi:hypothetical protein